MWKRPGYYDDPFTSPNPQTEPGTLFRWANRIVRPVRFSGRRLTPLKVCITFLLIGCLLLAQDWLPRIPHSRVSEHNFPALSPFPASFIADSHTFQDTSGICNTSPVPRAAFQPPESTEYRIPDTIDTFETYKFRKTCNVSSLDLHAPFSPLCQDRASMLTAMSSGGRIGHDAPYMPRGCDMRWFSAEEICEILGRFDKVVLIGDSMLRHIIGSINILIRKDLGYGAVTDWNFSLQERCH
jgi:hypothetical protein